jgi:hypothetical protein
MDEVDDVPVRRTSGRVIFVTLDVFECKGLILVDMHIHQSVDQADILDILRLRVWNSDI